jgi:hypothetical protein
MVWIGDIDVPIISSQNSDLILETIDKDFVDNPPQSYKLYSNLEAGTYSFLLVEETHARSHSLQEQRDAMLGMVERHGTEFPINYRSDTGFLIANSLDLFETSSELYDEAEMDVRFMPYDDYKAGLITNAENHSTDFTVTEESLFAVDSSVNVYKNGSLKSGYATITTDDGDVDYYWYSDDTLGLEIDPFDSEYERVGLCRLFSSGRIYSTRKPIGEFVLNNSIVKADFANNESVISAFDSNWSEIATVPFAHTDGYVEKNTNDSIICHSTTDESASIYRAIPAVEYGIKNRSKFEVQFTTNSVVSQDNHYIAVSDDSGNEIIVVKGEDVGSDFQVNSDSITVDSIGNEETTYFVGFVPSELTAEEVARASFSRGNLRRTFLKNA